MDSPETYDKLAQAAAAVRERTSVQPRIALILGSGLGPLADEVSEALSIPYTDIPHFRVSTAPGHAGRLVLGLLEEQPVAIMAGRVHMYEGYSPQDVVFPVLTMRQLGAEVLVVTNAAGGINPSFPSGTLMLIADHINLTGHNP